MKRLVLVSTICLLLALPAAVLAQVTNLDTWIDTDFDGLPANVIRTLNVGVVDSFAIYVDLTGFPTATWTNFLYGFSLGPGPDSTTNYFSSDTADVDVRYANTSGSIFPINNFQLTYVIQLGGSGFNVPVVAGPSLFAVVQVRPIRPSAVGMGCVVPQISTSNPAYLFSQFGNGSAYGLFDAGTVTQGCYTIAGGPSATDATSWGRLKGLYK